MGCWTALRKHSTRLLAIQLRLLCVIQLLTGLGFIGFSCYLQTPPNDSLTLGLIIIGALAVVSSVFGFIVSCSRGCCLTVFLTLGVMVTLAQAGFALYLFIAPQDAVDKLVEQKGGGDMDSKFHDAVYIGRWVFLGAMAAQTLAMVLAVVLRAVSQGEQYETFVEEEMEQRRESAAQQLEVLKEKIQGSGASLQTKAPINVHVPSVASQRRSLFRTESDDAKLDLESGTIPAMPAATNAEPLGAWTPRAPPQQPEQQQQQQRSWKATWSKAGSQGNI